MKENYYFQAYQTEISICTTGSIGGKSADDGRICRR
jgi:hypothetical protein